MLRFSICTLVHLAYYLQYAYILAQLKARRDLIQSTLEFDWKNVCNIGGACCTSVRG